MRYIPALDGLRALAVIAVMAHHTNVPGFQMGFLGVDVFFVLSGYLITAILLKQEAEGGIRLLPFYVRRARRLYPALMVMIGLYLGIAWIMRADPRWMEVAHWQDALMAATYTSDYFKAFTNRPTMIGHTWSLAVEEHFYLLWPLVVMRLARMKRNHAALLLAGIAIVSWAWRDWSFVHLGRLATYARFDTHLTGLVLGSLLAFVPVVRAPRLLFAVMAAAAMASVYLQGEGQYMRAISAAEVGSAALVMWAIGERRPALEWGPLVYLGQISYGLYLFHVPILKALWALPWPAVTLLTFTATIAIAAVSYATVETRFRYPRKLRGALSSA